MWSSRRTRGNSCRSSSGICGAVEERTMASPVPLLVVDDHPGNGSALRAILSSPDYRIVEAASAAEALLRLLQEDFAVPLLDALMPDMSGLDQATAVKDRERTTTSEILFLQAWCTDAP